MKSILTVDGSRKKMNLTRKTKQENLEETQLYRSRQASLLVDDMIEEKLTQLQVFISQLNHTPHGRAELERRTDRYGDCKRIEGETSGQFYAKLRNWLDKTCE
jgi:hypothetical protein